MAQPPTAPHEQGNSRTPLYIGVVIALILFGAVVGVGTTFLFSPTQPTAEQHTAINYTALYEQSKDSVVRVQVVSNGDISEGSGFVYNENGIIVTNAHVVTGGTSVDVQYSTGEWVNATVVGIDPDTDLAVLKPASTPKTVTPLDIAETNPERGEKVMVVGSPLDLKQSVSHGIVSGVGRELRRDNGFLIPDVVQTDAPVNPGNSGGPVLNTDGKVVGVITARQGDNIGFAISPELVDAIVPRLLNSPNGTIKHSYVGIRTVDNGPQVAEANGYDQQTGMVVVDVMEGSPAAGVLQAPDQQTITSADGVRVFEGGDIITAIDGQPVHSGEDLSSYLMKETTPGDTVTLTIIRDGEKKTVELTLTQRP